MRFRLTSLAMAAALLIALASAGPASAALWLEFDSASGAPGDWVHAHTVGSGAFGPGLRSSRYAVYLAPQAIAGAIEAPDDPALRLVGRLVIDPRGDGSVTFRVPELQPGRYAVFVFCPGCAAHSAGQALLWAAEFRIAPRFDPCDATAARPFVLISC